MTKRKIWIILFIIGIVMILGASEFSRFLANEINWYTAGIILSIRPLAKLSKAVKVADTSNQGKAESKALSPVTVTFREDTKPFEKTDGVFNKDTFS